jgi:PKD repeat protein
MFLLTAAALTASSVLALGPATGAAEGDSRQLTRIASPSVDQVVGHGRVRVVVQSRASLGQLRVAVDGRDIKRSLHRSHGAYRATLRLGHGLHYGVNELTVRTRGQADFDRVKFIVARLAPKLLTLGNLRVGGSEAPVRVTVRAARGTTLQAFVNGHSVDGAFHPHGNVYIGHLGANDWLRAGRNRLVVLTYRAHAYKRSAVYDAEAKTFKLARGRLLAGAGRNQVVDGGDFVRLDGSSSQVAVAAAARVAQSLDPTQDDDPLSYDWQIVGAPDGSTATLDDPTSQTPGLEPDLPGDYMIQLTVTAADGTTSTDTVTITVRADVPPIGAPLQTVSDDRGTIALNGQPVADTTESCDPGADGRGCTGRYSYAVFNRQTLELVKSGNGTADIPGTKALADLAGTYNAAPTYLMVVNMQAITGNVADAQRLFETLGVTKFSADDLAKTVSLGLPVPVSVVGVPGSPLGSAFISNHFLACKCVAARHLANMSGYARLNPLSTTGDFEFVFPDQVEFDTAAGQSATQVTMKVGGATYAHDMPTDGSSGFYLLRLDSLTLAPIQDFFYVTNAPNGAENAAEAQRMASDLAWSTAPEHGHGEQLVLLQAFGKPKGTSKGWGQAAQAIERLGGTRQVFDWLNQGQAAGLEAGTGRYAFVGRSSMTGPGSESSQALTGKATDGKLHGLLARSRDVQYQPLLADPLGTVNFDLVRIVNRPSAAGGGFRQFSAGEAAAASFLGRDSDVMGVCDRAAPTCDVRKAYYKNYVGTSWATILTRLGNDATKAKCAQGGPGFTPTECDTVRQQLELEVGRRNTVEAYFGQNGLQGPFLGGVQVAALVDIAAIAEQIRTAVQPPAADNATSNALSIVSFVTKIAGLAGAVFPPAAAVASGVGAGFGLAAYLTHHDGSPDLVGPQVTKAAAGLGGELFDRYQRASAYFTTEAKIIMSDFTKMTDVATVATSDPKWILGDISTSTESIRQGTKQGIYQSLVPVAYPVIYDLGTGVGHATQWICRSPSILLYDKNLFQNTSQGAEIPYKLPEVGPNETHMMAVGGRHTVGSLHSAYVPAPPDSLTGPLFRDPAAPQGGGIGLYKLSFYAPRYFQMFSPVLQQRKPRRGNYGYQTCQSMPNPPDNGG